MDFHEKAKAITAAVLKISETRRARATALKIHQRAKVWRTSADPEDLHWELKTREALEQATCDLKAAEAELRRLKLIKH